MMMEACRRVRKKHRRVALSSEDDDDDEYEQQSRRANTLVPTWRGSRQVAVAYANDDDDGNDEEVAVDDDDNSDDNVKIEPVAAPRRSASARKKQRSSSHNESGVYTMQKSAIAKQSKKLNHPLSAASSTSNSSSLSLLAATPASSSPSVSAATPPRVLNAILTIGDWLDVLDYVGVWNVGQVLSIPSDNSVEVRYDGWGKRYNEVVALDSSRVAPFHTYTWSVKCWAKYLNWPWWPAVTNLANCFIVPLPRQMTVRTPGTPDGAKNLRIVDEVYVDFVDSKVFATRCRCWVNKRDVMPFDANFEQLRKKTNGAGFEFSLKQVLKATATTKFPTFVRGTLPKQYELTVTMPVRKMKKVMGNAMWLKDFADNRERHNRMHGYHNAIVGSQDGKDEVMAILGLQEELRRQLKERKRKNELPRTPTRRRNKENEAPKSSHSGKQASPRSPRVVVADTATNVILPQNVIFHSDDIIVEDEDEGDDDESGRGHATQKRPLSRVITSHKRLRSVTKMTKTARVKDIASSYDDSDAGSDDKSEDESASEDENEEINRVSLSRAVTREVAAKERHDPRKRVLRLLPAATAPIKKRPSVARNLWLQSFTDRINSVKKEPRRNADVSPPRGTDRNDEEGGNARNNSRSSDSEGNEDYEITTEENSEERLPDAEDDTALQVVPAPSPISVLDTEDVEILEVKPVERWTRKQEKQEIKTKVLEEDSAPASLNELRQKPKRSSPVKRAALPVTPAKPKKKSLPRKRPATIAAVATSSSSAVAKRKPPRTLMDMRMAQAQEAICALEEKQERKKEEAPPSAAERRSLAKLRQIKGGSRAVRSKATFLTSLTAFPGLNLSERSSLPTAFLQPTLATELSDDEDESSSQAPVAFPGLSSSTHLQVVHGKKKGLVGGSGASSTRPAKVRKTCHKSPNFKENRVSNEENEQKTEKDGEDEKGGKDDGDEKDDDVVPQLRRRFCMMRASTRGEKPLSIAYGIRVIMFPLLTVWWCLFFLVEPLFTVGEALTAQEKVRAFQSKKKNESMMRVRAPNMFSDPQSIVSTTTARSPSLSVIPLSVSDSSGELTHSMLRVADSLSLPTLSSSSSNRVGGGDDRGGPIFSSSADFSINSWFKQQLC